MADLDGETIVDSTRIWGWVTATDVTIKRETPSTYYLQGVTLQFDKRYSVLNDVENIDFQYHNDTTLLTINTRIPSTSCDARGRPILKSRYTWDSWKQGERSIARVYCKPSPRMGWSDSLAHFAVGRDSNKQVWAAFTIEFA